MQSILCFSLFLGCDGPRVEKQKKIWQRSGDTAADNEIQLNPKPSFPPATAPIPTGTFKPDVTMPALIGKWKGPCINASKVQKTEILFSGNQVIFTVDLFAKKNCDRLSHTLIIYSTFSTQNIQRSDIFGIDFKLAKIGLTPRTKDSAGESSDLELYGIKNWEVNKESDVTGKRESSEDEALPAAGQILYDVFRIQNNILVFALASLNFDVRLRTIELNGTTSEKRPRAINDAVSFTQ